MLSRTFTLLAAIVALALVAASATAVETGQAAPDFQLRDPSGREVRLSGLKGKVVLVDFWASWCAPCRQSMPVLEKLSKTYRDKGLVVLGVNIDDDTKKAAQFMKDVPVSFGVLLDTKKSAAKLYAPPTMPSSYLVDREGKVRAVHAGFKASDEAKLEAEVQALLR